MKESLAQPNGYYTDEGVDPLSLLTPLIERRRAILLGSILIALIVGGIAALSPRKYKAELALTPVTNNKSSAALGGIAALAGASLQTGYQLTPARMVELIKSRTVLSGVGMSRIKPSSSETVIDRIMGEKYTRNDREEIAKRMVRLLDVTANKETGTITVAIQHPDSALARMIATRVVDSASQIFVSTSKAQAQQLRMAQERRVATARQDLEQAEERLRQFNYSNRATPGFSVASVERTRLSREIQFAEQVYTQAATDQESAYARELEATPTVVVQDPLPDVLPKVRKRIILKTVVAGLVSFVLIALGVLVVDLTRRRLRRSDEESDRFRRALSTLPRFRRSAAQ
ncbi:MAG TPA: Wzz/FepE/Etk N-terminal domain-containing protein [Gemmatimonadaceae bacterium]|nr:Wzz/FepE/Etk N-terminal domain-containing protein [Gemmatimonadaceae bacterium]